MKKVLITLSCLLLIVVGLKAQEKNLWHDPGFEETDVDRYDNIVSKYWNIGGVLIGSWNTETNDVYKGKRSIKLSADANKYLGVFNEDYNDRSYPCKVGDNFTFSYWHKGTMKIKGLEVTVRLYYEGSNYKDKVIYNSEVMTQPEDWVQHKVDFKITPEDVGDKAVTHFAVKLKVPYEFNADGYILLDEFSLMLTPETPVEVPDVPVIKETVFEHEIELEWTKTNDKDITWELVVDGKTIPTTEPQYTLTQLNDNTAHKVKVRAIKGEMQSDFSEEKTITTKKIAIAIEDTDRLPHLRTIAPNGSVHNKRIQLFYNNLYNIKDTKITYKIDGKIVEAKDNILMFPKTGMQTLEVEIVEDANRTWTLNYKLNVIE